MYIQENLLKSANEGGSVKRLLWQGERAISYLVMC